jgi:CDP-glucose 4,6-dehydratase
VFWNGRRVAVTGHTGFKGAWLAYILQRSGAEVYGYALPPDTEPNLFGALALHELVNSTFADIRDPSAFAAFFRKARPDIVFHLAAQSLVRTGYERPSETFEVNVQGTVSCLEQALALGVGVVVAATTDKCYRNDGARAKPFVEHDELGGADPYSASKAAAEIAIESYRASFFRPRGLSLASVRAGNVIGGGDWSNDRIFTDLARAAFEGRPLQVRNPRSVRPWQHVIDALRGYLSIAEAARSGLQVDEAWNIGPSSGGDVTVEEIIGMFERAVGKALPVERVISSEKPEAPSLRLDVRKARERLGWQPRLSTAEAVNMTARWYAKFYAREPMRQFTAAQIAHVQPQLGVAGITGQR